MNLTFDHWCAQRVVLRRKLPSSKLDTANLPKKESVISDILNASSSGLANRFEIIPDPLVACKSPLKENKFSDKAEHTFFSIKDGMILSRN